VDLIIDLETRLPEVQYSDVGSYISTWVPYHFLKKL